ncbi:MAG: 16S rRNA (uracil(1498)-N(3))-methyltransferase [Desulfobacteraceae bacterium]|nr:MAG: 16S rRNA (uracil(1498)-N(3))-methyltransferase [Desulfobacteraceae bacterium]
MNLVLLTREDFISHDRVRISDRRMDHLVKVNRITQGDTLQCGLINHNMGVGTVTRLTASFVELSVTLEHEPPRKLPLSLIIALPRPKMLRRIITTATELGVGEIFLINSWRVEKSYWQTPWLADHHIREYMTKGLEQSKDTVLPKIHMKRFFSRFVNDELPSFLKNHLCLLAHPKGRQSLPTQVAENVILAVGPEGGFIDREVETFERIGFMCGTAGKRIMRVETAVPYLIASLFS